MASFIRSLEMYNGAITAASTVLIAIFTIVLACVTNRQLSLANKSINLAREEFISTHRPVIKVRRLVFISPMLDFGPEVISHGDEVEITIEVANTGGVSATLTAGKYGILFSKTSLPSDKARDMTHKFKDTPAVFAVGERRIFELTSTAELKASNGRITNQFKADGWSMSVFGEIVYRDDLGRERVTGFARRWEGNGFERIEGSDYEYED